MMSFSPDPNIAEQQMNAIIYYLTSFGFVDGEFDRSERGFIEQFIGQLVEHRANDLMPDAELPVKVEVITRWTQHFHQVLSDIEGEIRAYLEEPVAEGENSRQFVTSRLKLRCFELFKGFDEDNRAALLATADELIHADGEVHPEEEKFRSELSGLLEAPIDLEEDEIELLESGDVVIKQERRMQAAKADHPFFKKFEVDYDFGDKDTFEKQATADMGVVRRAIDKLEEMREAGKGRLSGVADVTKLPAGAPFLDGHIYGIVPEAGKDYELLVLGDLHGCYSCLKAALLQVDFFSKVQAYHDDPDNNPITKLILLGDYIDRGRYSYNGILRTVLQLFLTVPGHVYPLRGNHEYYVELNGRVYGAVRPSEAMNSLLNIASNDMFAEYMRLFEALPNLLFFDKMLFVHAGIPRDDTFADKYQDLSSLNDPEIRFQMLWSDPSDADAIPLDLQKANARFPFGRKQFRHFMAKTGCRTLIRGHERVIEGFKTIYDMPDARLLNLFSAGGKNNNDLPETSNYREVRPMALSIHHKDGISQITPFAIEYERYNDPRYNAFFREALEAGAEG